MTATACIQPIDMVKVRLQLSGEGGTAAVRNPFTMARTIMAEGGIASFYKGLSAGLLRQATYGTARLGLFRTMSNALAEPGSKDTKAWKSVVAGLGSGGLAAVVGNPCDLALIRMQADATLPESQRRNYRNVIHALTSIVKQEGVLALWNGCMPTVYRAMAINAGQLACYDISKRIITEHLGTGQATNLSASLVAGFFGSAASLPFDFIKTRLQKQKAGPDGKLPYAGSFDCCVKTVANEGIFAFYKGFGAYFVRIAPHAIITLNLLEFLNKSAKNQGWL